MIELKLYVRAGCHLCEEMKAGLAALSCGTGFRLIEIDVGWEGELADLHGQWVPVLMHDEHEVCHYILDEKRVRAILESRSSIPE